MAVRSRAPSAKARAADNVRRKESPNEGWNWRLQPEKIRRWQRRFAGRRQVRVISAKPATRTEVGPGKDIVGTWERVARAQGLRFGITVQGTPGRVWKQFIPVRYGSDATGPLKGVPYDGVLRKADGKGKW
jgi:hypothetical protein